MHRILILLLFALSCSSAGQQQNLEIINAEQLIQLREEGVQVVDIRTLRAFEQGHLPNVIHEDFLQAGFIKRMQQFETKNAIIIHCASGGRSAKASKLLIEAGFTQVYDYAGGFIDWKSKGLTIEQ